MVAPVLKLTEKTHRDDVVLLIKRLKLTAGHVPTVNSCTAEGLLSCALTLKKFGRHVFCFIFRWRPEEKRKCIKGYFGALGALCHVNAFTVNDLEYIFKWMWKLGGGTVSVTVRLHKRKRRINNIVLWRLLRGVGRQCIFNGKLEGRVAKSFVLQQNWATFTLLSQVVF